MQCPFCGGDNDKVVDSRSSDGSRAVRRRRECIRCHRRYTTYERVEEAVRINVVKKDGSRVPFDRQKVMAGLEKAVYKRPISSDKLREIVDAVEEEIFSTSDKEVTSKRIGELVCAQLAKVDKVAYIRFASVYREFNDVGELIEQAQEVRDLPAEQPHQPNLFGGQSPAEGPEKKA